MQTKQQIFDDFKSSINESIADLRKALGIDEPDTPTPPFPPTPPTPRIRHCNGIYVLDPGEENRSYNEKDLRLEYVTGGTIRFRRPWVMRPTEDGKTSWNWDFLDRYIDLHHKVGKPYTLLPMSGDHPRPWEEDNIKAYMELIQVCGDKYSKDELLTGWHVTGCTPQGTSEELHWLTTEFTEKVLTECMQLTLTSITSFPYCDINQSISNKSKNNNIEKLIEYGAGMAPGRYRIGHNALKAIEITAGHNKRVWENAKKFRTLIRWEPAASYKYESSRMGPGDVNKMIQQAYTMAGYAGIKPSDAYIAVYWPDIHDINPNIIAK